MTTGLGINASIVRRIIRTASQQSRNPVKRTPDTPYEVKTGSKAIHYASMTVSD